MGDVTKRMTKTSAPLAVLYGAQRYCRNWGATKAEYQTRLPGDAASSRTGICSPLGSLEVLRCAM